MEPVYPDNIIIEFLEVSVHQLLYVHQIYPGGIFSRKQKYGVPVQVSGHPLVNNYITQCLKTALDLLKQNQLAKLMLVFCSNNGDIVKKIIFDITKLQHTIARQDEERLEMAFRDVFVRLSVCDRCLQPLPPGCTFKILLATQEQSHIDMGKNTALRANQEFPWTRSSCQQVKIHAAAIVPLSSLESCGIEVQVYAEELRSEMLQQFEL